VLLLKVGGAIKYTERRISYKLFKTFVYENSFVELIVLIMVVDFKKYNYREKSTL